MQAFPNTSKGFFSILFRLENIVVILLSIVWMPFLMQEKKLVESKSTDSITCITICVKSLERNSC